MVIGLGGFVLFCANGDVWLIDAFAEDALNLMRGCAREEFSMFEDSTTLRIEWRGTYSIDGDFFATTRTGLWHLPAAHALHGFAVRPWFIG